MQKKQAYREREKWMAAVVADGRLTRGEPALAIRLALHKNLEMGRCDPGVETLAEGTGMKVRNVQYSLEGLQQKGWIKRQMRSGKSTQYELSSGVQCVAPPSEREGVQENG